jgi:hypothetical protein
MKKILVVTTAVTVLAAVSSAFANPSYEAEWDYDSWRAAQRAAAGKVFTPWTTAPALEPNGDASTTRRIKPLGGRH